jgi:PilZ domain-containing protein
MTRTNHAAVLMRDLAMRVIDISASGCLIESRRRVEVGTVGRLRLKFGSDECADDVEVVRCERVEDARSLFHVGVRFLWTTPREVGSIRHAVIHHANDLDTARTVWVM